MTLAALENFIRVQEKLDRALFRPARLQAMAAGPLADLTRSQAVLRSTPGMTALGGDPWRLRASASLRNSMAVTTPRGVDVGASMRMLDLASAMERYFRSPVVDALSTFERSILGHLETASRDQEKIERVLRATAPFQLAYPGHPRYPLDEQAEQLRPIVERWAAALERFSPTREQAEILLRYVALTLATTMITLAWAGVEVSRRTETTIAWLWAIAYVLVLFLPGGSEDG